MTLRPLWPLWCRDAFYARVSARDLATGLRSLKDGGTPARLLVLDDGWQMSAVDAQYSRFQTSNVPREGDGNASSVRPDDKDPEDLAVAMDAANMLQGACFANTMNHQCVLRVSAVFYEELQEPIGACLPPSGSETNVVEPLHAELERRKEEAAKVKRPVRWELSQAAWAVSIKVLLRLSMPGQHAKRTLNLVLAAARP